MEALLSWVDDYTLRTVALGSAMLGLVSGVLGTFALLRRQSLLGDALSHAALPGIALAFLFTRSKSILVLVMGAAVAAWLGALLIDSVVRNTRVKTDAAMAVVLSVFFGVGLVLLTYIQRLPDAGKSGLDTFLFGQAAALLERDLYLMAALGGGALLVVALLWKEFKLLAFDPGFASSLGLPIRGLERVLTTALVIAIVIGLQAVGVVLMSALVVAPAAAARQWTNRLSAMVVISGGFGAVSGASGALISSSVPRLPTGPMIVIVASGIVILSLLFAPRRGLVIGALRKRAGRKRLRSEVVLVDLYLLSLQHEVRHPHTTESIAGMRYQSGDVVASLDTLTARGLVARSGAGWVLTETGERLAKELLMLEQDASEAQLAVALAGRAPR
ncbi:MAG: metal ABC transporter permease [Actinomycetota bacterium]